MPDVAESPTNRKRKLDDDPAIEIDLSAPEPPSKKALRKSKKKSGGDTEAPESAPAPAPAAAESDDDDDDDGVQKARKQSSDQRAKYGVWIGNLPFSVTKDDLRTFLTTRCAVNEDGITRIHLPSNPDKRRGMHQSKGFAYVDFTTSDAVQQAIGLSEQLLYGRRVLIKDATDFAGRPAPDSGKNSGTSEGAKQSRNAPSQKIFVGNLAFDVAKERLEEHFGRCGPISTVHMATFEDSGKCKGYAWVEFEAVESAEAAVRGSVMVPDEDAIEEPDDEKDNRKQKMKKIWVNRLLGRTLRREFAEDPTTRYQKRFGKEGKTRGADAQAVTGDRIGMGSGTPAAIEEVSEKDVGATRPSTTGNKQRQKSKPGPQTRNGYSEDTVQRLSGAIVTSQGKKTTFG